MKTHWTFRKATITIFSENSFNVLMLTMKLVNEVLLTIATVMHFCFHFHILFVLLEL